MRTTTGSDSFTTSEIETEKEWGFGKIAEPDRDGVS